MRHQFWAVGDAECPPELRAPNGELHTTRCKACGDGWRRTGNLCLSKAASDVLAERQRQVEKEGWTPEHDDEHTDGSMARAAAAYCLCAEGPPRPGEPSEFHSSRPWDFNILRAIWPRSWNWPRPKDRRRNLVRAAALILAEIERLDRAAGKAGVRVGDERQPPLPRDLDPSVPRGEGTATNGVDASRGGEHG
jgi:hypothetical protein